MAGAWEILEVRRNRVLVVILIPPDMKVSFQWALNLRQLQLPDSSATMTPMGLPFGPARNTGAKHALDGGFGYVFFLDSDVIPPPNIIPTLIATGRDYISGLYYRRFPPYEPAAGVGVWREGRLEMAQFPQFNFGDIIPVDFLPAGALLISRRCLEAVFSACPKPFEWYGDVDAPGSLSEDYSFSLKAAGLGFRPWLHTGIVCRHEMAMTAGPRGAEVLR